MSDSFDTSGITAVYDPLDPVLDVVPVGTAVSVDRANRGEWNGSWFDADDAGNRLPITLASVATGGSGDIGALADRVLDQIGR